MKLIYPLYISSCLFILSCTSNESKPDSILPNVATKDFLIVERSADEDVDANTLVFKDQLCYKFRDESGNISEFEIAYQPETGIMYAITTEVIPMIDGIIIYPDATYKMLGQNERGEKISSTYKNGRDLVIQIKDEDGITYPKDLPQTNYLLENGNSIVYRDGLESSREFIKSNLYTVNHTKTGDYMNLHITGAYPFLNARLLYGLAQIPGDVGLFFMPFGELWNISSKQWPTLISSKNYSLEMTCFGFTDYHVDPTLYKEENK